MGAGINPALNRIAELNVGMRLAILLCKSKPITMGLPRCSFYESDLARPS